MRVWTILCAALLILPGRVLGDETPELSDAMKAAASADDTPTTGNRSRRSDDSDDDSVVGSMIGSMIVDILENLHGVQYGDTEYFWQLPVDAAYVIPLNGDIRGITRFSITPFSVEGERASFGLYFNGGLVGMEHGSLPDAATRSATTIGFGAAFRYYFIRPEKPFNPYVTAQVGWQGLRWEYRGGTISNDSLSALDTCLGFGVTFNRDRWFSLYGELGFGGTFFKHQTYEGFHNDVFNNFGYFSVKAGLSLKF
jgi:hypothetical protein